MKEVNLRRRGFWLLAEQESWQMQSVQGPVAVESGRQFFHVETASKELLLISRPAGERGMRNLRLDSVLYRAS
jgi:hypothetical protein